MFVNKLITYPKQIKLFATCYSTSATQLKNPFISLFERTTGQTISEHFVSKLKKKYPNILNLKHEDLSNTLQILGKFSITAEQACLDPHIFCMNAITMENYGDILMECCFTSIVPKHIIRYHTLIKSRTISRLKKEGLLRHDLDLKEVLHQCFPNWPCKDITPTNFPDSSTNIVTVRMYVLEKYLKWKLNITTDQFQNYCKNYLPLRHRPMCDVQEALNIAENNIKFNIDSIKRNGFIISADPVNTKLILDNVHTLGGLDIREAIKIEPAILKNNYESLLKIKNILEEFNVSEETQRHTFKVYCMHPQTVKERLQDISDLKEYKFLATNTRMLSLVVHEKKMMRRLEKIQETKKQCFGLSHLVSSSKEFDVYINSFGDKTSSRDIGLLISSNLIGQHITKNTILNKLRRHKYWLYTSLNSILENLQMLKGEFDDQDIFDNCQILLYPISELKHYLKNLTKAKEENREEWLDASYKNVNFNEITNNQLLSLVLYDIEKKFYFSGDGIWDKQDGTKIDIPGKRVKQSAQ